MITCFFQGGLGNQLFQVGAGFSAALDAGTEFCINYSRTLPLTQGKQSATYKDTIFSNIKETDYYPTKVFREEKAEFFPLPKEQEYTIFGYFQSEKYFLPHREKYLNLIRPSEKLYSPTKSFLKKIKTNLPIVGVHIRRGDYLKLPHAHFTLSLDYYKEAMAYHPNSLFVITTDDMQWAKSNFLGDNIFFSPFSDEINDLCLLMGCDHNIISNSTFSWWAAYLNENPNKMVICPHKWFHNGTNKDLIPSSWIVAKNL
jgi:hypothetical protein